MGRIWEAQKTGETTEMFDHETGDSGVPVPSAFHLKSREVGGGCAAAGTKETSGESASNMDPWM